MIKEIQAGMFRITVGLERKLQKESLYLKMFIVWIEEHSKEHTEQFSECSY
jgi:hypothetical protein